MSVPELKLAFITQPEVSPSGSHCTTMAPKYNVRKTSSVAVKEENIFPAVSSEAGRPKETTTETPDEETEQPNVLALEEAHREREQPSPCSSERQKRKDPPPVSKDVTVDPTEAKRRRVNWSKGDNRAKLQASLLKWRNLGFLDENANDRICEHRRHSTAHLLHIRKWEASRRSSCWNEEEECGIEDGQSQSHSAQRTR
jgi:hypothetical protein